MKVSDYILVFEDRAVQRTHASAKLVSSAQAAHTTGLVGAVAIAGVF